MRKFIFLLLFLLGTMSSYAQSGSIPQILSFSLEGVYVNRSDLLAGTARVAVRWEVVNRSESMNLAFEQILPDGSIVNIELLHSNPWVNSVDRGIIALLDPGASAWDIQVQLRLYSTSNGATLDNWVHILAIYELPANPDVLINRFTINSDSASEGDTVTVNWDVSGVDAVHIGISHTGMRIYSVNEFDSYPNVGTAEFTVPEGVRTVRFLLFANESLEQSLTIAVNCHIDWLVAVYDDACPAAEAEIIPVVYQNFEGGYMISGTNERGYVWIYSEEHGQFFVRPSGDASELTETAPSGLFQPSSAFSYIWSQDSYLREYLGWAIEPEQVYSMLYQRSPLPIGTGASRYFVFSLPDGTIISAFMPAFYL